MQISTDSQCYFVQLQIDSFLDGELVVAQLEVFMGHVHSCEACAKELHFARSLHDAVMDLPMLDCSDLTLEPVHRISQLGRQPEPLPVWALGSFLQPVNDWLSAMPLSLRFVAPALAFAVVAMLMSGQLLETNVALPNQQAVNTTADGYSPEEIQKALLDLNLAIEYLNDVSKRTEVMIGERFVVTPLQESLNASFDRPRLNRRNGGSRGLRNDPI